MPDKNGKPWATVAGTKKGSILRPGAGFACLTNAVAITVEEDKDGLYVRCTHGRHGLDGQLSEDETEYVGFYNYFYTPAVGG